MKVLILCCVVAVAVALDYDYGDYDYDKESKRSSLRKSRKRDRDVDDYDYYEDDYDHEERGPAKKKKSDDEDYYQDEYDYDNDKRSNRMRSRKRSEKYDKFDDEYDDDYEEPKRRRNRKSRTKTRNFRKYQRSGHMNGDYSDDNDVDQYDYDNDYDTVKDDEDVDDYGYPESMRGQQRRSMYGNYGQMSMMGRGFGRRNMGMSARSMGYAARASKPRKPAVTKFVPVVVKKKQKKKSKIITVDKGFYIPGGTQMFGKFNDLHSCEKACEISSTCFQGDYNPWLKKCYGHGNLTACTSKKTHDKLIHFSKVPCEILETPRGLVTLGARAQKGVEMKGVDSLQKCIKICANMGGGIAAKNTDDVIDETPQICFAADYNFEDHKCYIHTNLKMCKAVTPAVTPENLVKAPSNVNILICPLSKD